MRFLTLFFVLSAAPAAAMDLSAAADAAVMRSPAAAEAKARREQAQAAGREAYWSRWPRLSARASAMRSDDPLFSFGALMTQRAVTAPDFNPDRLNHPGYRTAVHGGLELGVPLFTGFEANLLQSAFTGWCLMEDILRKVGAAPPPSPQAG